MVERAHSYEEKGPQYCEAVGNIVEAIGKREPWQPEGSKREELVRGLREALKKVGIETEIEEREKIILLDNPQLRARIGKSGEGERVEVFIDSGGWKELDALEEEDMEALRDSEGQRTYAFLAMLGKERFRTLVVECYRIAIESGYSGKIGGYEGTEGRGTMQFLADILALALLEEGSSDFQERFSELLGRINRRIWRSLQKAEKDQQREEIDSVFRKAGIEEPTAKIAGFPIEKIENIFAILELTSKG